jgi:hypothetical protein
MATPNQITKRLQKANFPLAGLTISRNEIEICIDYKEIDNNGHKFGTCNERKTRKAAKAIQKLFPEFTGEISTQYGAIILSPSSFKHSGEFCDVSSSHHY